MTDPLISKSLADLECTYFVESIALLTSVIWEMLDIESPYGYTFKASISVCPTVFNSI
jgi:hypothetical protein